MINGKKILVYIPARAGSKGIKDKNIIEVCGKPLIAYSIEAAKNSKYVDKVIVSTDSPSYAEISKLYDADVPFLRPAELATDTSIEMDTTKHLMAWIENHLLEQYQMIIRLQPTSPLRISKDLDLAIEKFVEKNADSIIGVTECSVSPLWTNTLPSDHSMANFINKEIMTKNRQELPVYYRLNGSIFIADWNFMKENWSWFGKNSYAIVIPEERAVDIDNSIDLELAEVLLKKRKKESDKA
jgi:CMP-N,N'-diacetyllegionaminic acid synthase